MERALVLARGTRIQVEDLPDELRHAAPVHIRGATEMPAAARTLADVERDHILAVLDSAGGNRTKAAAALGMGAATLFRKLRRYGVLTAASR